MNSLGAVEGLDDSGREGGSIEGFEGGFEGGPEGGLIGAISDSELSF